MGTIRNVSGTAFVVAEFRAEENNETTPLYRDPVVSLFLDEDSRHAAGCVAASFPHVKDLVRIRTKYLDDTLDERIRSACRQVVVLGAGLDTRAVRKQARGVTYFEIDDPATLRVKERRYRDHRLGVNVRFIPGDYVKDGMIDLLTRNGFDVDRPTYVIWEGNTMYLPMDRVAHTLAELRAHVGTFHLSFDYMAEAVIAKTTGDPAITRLVESFERMGAPWLSGIRDIRDLAREAGLQVVENVRTSELYRKYWLGRPLSSPIFDFYSLCTLAR